MFATSQGASHSDGAGGDSQAATDQASEVLASGKHKGLTFRQVYDAHPSYVAWVAKRGQRSGQLAAFHDYAKHRQMLATSANPPMVTASSATPALFALGGMPPPGAGSAAAGASLPPEVEDVGNDAGFNASAKLGGDHSSASALGASDSAGVNAAVADAAAISSTADNASAVLGVDVDDGGQGDADQAPPDDARLHTNHGSPVSRHVASVAITGNLAAGGNGAADSDAIVSDAAVEQSASPDQAGGYKRGRDEADIAGTGLDDAGNDELPRKAMLVSEGALGNNHGDMEEPMGNVNEMFGDAE